MPKLQAQPRERTSIGVLICRFIAGRDLDGQRRTNATFLRHGDRDLTEHGRASRWAHRRHADRAAIRVTALSIALAFGWGMLVHRTVTLITALCVTLALACLIVWRGVVTVRLARHNWRFVRPMWRTVAPHLGHATGHPHTRYMSVPRDFRTSEKAVIRIRLNPEWEGIEGQRRNVTKIITNRLGGEWTAYYAQHEYPPYLEFRKLPQPPERVALAEFIARIDAAPDSMLVLGMGINGAVIAVNLDSDAPHIALSMGTGGGKSDTVALIIAMLLRKGVRHIDVLDPKRISQNWARGLPGVSIHRYIEGQMRAISNAKILMDSRYDQMDGDADVVFDRHVLVIEEQNSLMDDLKEYWDDYRQMLEPADRSRCPKKNPAIQELRYILNKGRQCRINVISIFQRMSADATGGGDARENYGCKILCRASTQTWKMLVGTSHMAASAKSRIPGRACFVLGDDPQPVQRVFAAISKPDGSADKESITKLRQFALNGASDTGNVVTLADRKTVDIEGVSSDPIELVTLREAADAGIVPVKYGALRKARQRDSEFPAGVPGMGGQEYAPDALRAWHDNRIRARAA